MEYEKFDVERALAGEPVILRDGTKAYIKYQESELVVRCPILGFDVDGFSHAWDNLGKVIRGTRHSDDIVGMYPKEPLTMPDSFWGIVRADITAIAKDHNDSWFGYINCKPRIGTRSWIISTGEYVPLAAFPHMLFPDCAWEDSLILRPTK